MGEGDDVSDAEGEGAAAREPSERLTSARCAPCTSCSAKPASWRLTRGNKSLATSAARNARRKASLARPAALRPSTSAATVKLYVVPGVSSVMQYVGVGVAV